MPAIVRFHGTGEADVLKFDELPDTQPGDGEVRLKMAAIGLNRAEVMFRQGIYLETPELPSRLGYEAAGTVDAVGPGVSGIQVGDRESTIPSSRSSSSPLAWPAENSLSVMAWNPAPSNRSSPEPLLLTPSSMPTAIWSPTGRGAKSW
jgi:hypothetical protein